MLDEFANIGQIPNFDKLIATIRSREISASIILQSQSQLKTIYKDAADTIVGNCDSTLFLGGKEKSTLKEISELLGKETIDSFNQSENRGSQVSHGLTYQKLGKELMTQDELAVMDGGKCIRGNYLLHCHMLQTPVSPSSCPPGDRQPVHRAFPLACRIQSQSLFHLSCREKGYITYYT